MLLKHLVSEVQGLVTLHADANIEIDELVTDSRAKSENGVFFCIKGLRFDAHDYAQQAIDNGCVALVVETLLPIDVVQVQVENVRKAMAYIAATFFDHPEKEMRIVAVSGTKGKTTTNFLIKAICEKAGFYTGLIGTTGNMIGDRRVNSNMTTPDPIDLYRCLREMKDEGVQMVSMEASAHAVDMHRMEGLHFEVACFTNFSQDHLDYFETMENYFQTKKRLFTQGMVENGTFNVDDEHSGLIIEDIQMPRMTYGISADADLYARDIEITEDGVSFQLMFRSVEGVNISMNLTGMFNVYNAMAAASIAMVLGIDLQTIKEGLESVETVPGRVEMLTTGTAYRVILDYAHSPDALENILNTVRDFTKGRMIVLFGCGGDRDHGKRPIMGEIVGDMADFAILTSDNPRTEDPNLIIDAIEEGMKRTTGAYVRIENRREAISHALHMGQEGDVIILAGKGNETYQDIMGVKRPFDERLVVKELLEEMKTTKE